MIFGLEQLNTLDHVAIGVLIVLFILLVIIATKHVLLA